MPRKTSLRNFPRGSRRGRGGHANKSGHRQSKHTKNVGALKGKSFPHLALLRDHYQKSELVRTEGKMESKTSSMFSDLLLSTRTLMRGMMGTQPITFEMSGYSPLTTTAAGVLTYSQYGVTTAFQTIPMSGSTGGVNWSSEYSLIMGSNGIFDEFKCAGIRFHYEPYNPFNRGTTTNSDPFVLIYDDESVLASTGSASQLNIYSNRGPDRFVPFSPDKPFGHTFRRPASLSEYPWSSTSPDTTVNALNGSVALGYDSAVLTLSTRYGTMLWTFEMHARMRI